MTAGWRIKGFVHEYRVFATIATVLRRWVSLVLLRITRIVGHLIVIFSFSYRRLLRSEGTSLIAYIFLAIICTFLKQNSRLLTWWILTLDDLQSSVASYFGSTFRFIIAIVIDVCGDIVLRKESCRKIIWNYWCLQGRINTNFCNILTGLFWLLLLLQPCRNCLPLAKYLKLCPILAIKAILRGQTPCRLTIYEDLLVLLRTVILTVKWTAQQCVLVWITVTS